MSDGMPLRSAVFARGYLRGIKDAKALMPSSAYNLIGEDPTQRLHYDEENSVDAAMLRLREGTTRQQIGVPDQTQLAWRVDVDRVVNEVILLRSRLRRHRDALEERAENEAEAEAEARKSNFIRGYACAVAAQVKGTRADSNTRQLLRMVAAPEEILRCADSQDLEALYEAGCLVHPQA